MSFTKKKKMASMEMLRIFEVMSYCDNADGVCACEKYLRERLGQRNPQYDLTIRGNVGNYLPNDTA
jgi:hypothetical protein